MLRQHADPLECILRSFIIAVGITASLAVPVSALDAYPKHTYRFNSKEGDASQLDISLEILFNYHARTCKGKWIIKNNYDERVKVNIAVRCFLADGSTTERSVFMEINAQSTKQLYRGTMFKFENPATNIELIGEIHINRMGKKSSSQSMSHTNQSSADTAKHTSSDLPAYAEKKDVLNAMDLFRQSSESVVTILTEKGSGSGILIRENVVLTNCHVVGDFETVDVALFGLKDNKPVVNKQVKGAILFRNKENDIALLRIPTQSGRKTIKMRLDKPMIGEKAYVIGSPGLGNQLLELTLTDGIISGIDREIENRPFIQYTAPSNPGNSGGPLLDSYGLLIGVVTLAATLQNTNFAIPNDHLLGVLESSVKDEVILADDDEPSATPDGAGGAEPDTSEKDVQEKDSPNAPKKDISEKPATGDNESKMSDPDAPMWKKAKSLLQMAEMMEQNKSVSGALTYYKRIIEQYPISPQAVIAKERINALEKK
ncbi:MAG: trypsin-like peptidase domain-containing protein [Planctomycetota bacterium]